MNPVEEFLQEKTAGVAGEVVEKAPGFLGSLWKGMQFAPLLKKETPEALEGISGAQRFAHGLGGNLTGAAAIGLAGMTLDSGVRGARKMLNLGVDKVRKPMEYQAMIEAHPELRKEDAGRVQAYYNSLRHMSPHMAADPVIAGSFVRNLLDRGPEGSPAVPMETANMLAGIQKSVSGVQKDQGMLPPQAPVMGMMGSSLPTPYTQNATSKPPSKAPKGKSEE
jgi:hypothetical protein